MCIYVYMHTHISPQKLYLPEMLDVLTQYFSLFECLQILENKRTYIVLNLKLDLVTLFLWVLASSYRKDRKYRMRRSHVLPEGRLTLDALSGWTGLCANYPKDIILIHKGKDDNAKKCVIDPGSVSTESGNSNIETIYCIWMVGISPVNWCQETVNYDSDRKWVKIGIGPGNLWLSYIVLYIECVYFQANFSRLGTSIGF